MVRVVADDVPRRRPQRGVRTAPAAAAGSRARGGGSAGPGGFGAAGGGRAAGRGAGAAPGAADVRGDPRRGRCGGRGASDRAGHADPVLGRDRRSCSKARRGRRCATSPRTGPASRWSTAARTPRSFPSPRRAGRCWRGRTSCASPARCSTWHWSRDREQLDVWLKKGSVVVTGPLVEGGVAVGRDQHLSLRPSDHRIVLENGAGEAPRPRSRTTVHTPVAAGSRSPATRSSAERPSERSSPEHAAAPPRARGSWSGAWRRRLRRGHRGGPSGAGCARCWRAVRATTWPRWPTPPGTPGAPSWPAGR